MPALDGKVAIVTGASRGIGEAAALALGAAGASVVLAARSAQALEANVRTIVATGGKAFALECDVSDYEACQRLVHETANRFGPPDILVNNAGVIEPIGTVATAPPLEWARSIEINLIGAYFAIRAVLPGMLERGHGDIINVSSGAAHRPLEGWSAYCSGKAGLAMLTRAIDLEHSAAGIRVFGFQPGTTDTDMQVTIRASGINMISQIPREKLTPVALPAKAIVFLCTKEADDYKGKDFSLNDADFRRRALGDG
ncbi:MAG TPA: SDR family oxidoreductase [Acetobacteraceae bacterium]|jgi:3-oxoacyl-[acyl-carrier protein] reductase|nr:SDR family oxidoreductase [Acetobacteraceae bacterium]